MDMVTTTLTLAGTHEATDRRGMLIFPENIVCLP